MHTLIRVVANGENVHKQRRDRALEIPRNHGLYETKAT